MKLKKGGWGRLSTYNNEIRRGCNGRSCWRGKRIRSRGSLGNAGRGEALHSQTKYDVVVLDSGPEVGKENIYIIILYSVKIILLKN